MKKNYRTVINQQAQKGIALITVMIVLFVLTLLGLAATDSSNFQALMVRNNQFRLEAFNASRTEITDQLPFLAQNNSTLFLAIDTGNVLSTHDGTAPNDFTVITPTTTRMNQEIALEFLNADCETNGNSLGTLRCNVLRLDSDSSLVDSNVQSLQSQSFFYYTLPF